MSDLPDLIPLSDDEFWCRFAENGETLFVENEKSPEEEFGRYLAEGREELFAPPRKRKSMTCIKRARYGSLRDWAKALNKDPRQIRRYCELGLIPGARRTSGGHWRAKLNPHALQQAKRNLAGKTRQFDRLKESDLARAMRNSPPPLEDLWRPEDALRMGGLKHDIAVAILRLRCRGRIITRAAVAREMGVRRSTITRMLKKVHPGFFENLVRSTEKIEAMKYEQQMFGSRDDLPAKPNKLPSKISKLRFAI